MTLEEREKKKAHYTTIYSELIKVFNPRNINERKSLVLARAVIYRLSTLKGSELERYINFLEEEVKKNFLANVI